MYINLENATRELEELLGDIKLNPKRYVHFSFLVRMMLNIKILKIKL